MRQAAVEFQMANTQGDGVLDLKQFASMVRARLHQPELSLGKIKTWYGLLDGLVRSNEGVSFDEFFLFCIFDVTTQYGAVEMIFQTYDIDGSGKLSLHEFHNALAEMGFETASTALMKKFDADGSGEVSYAEVVKAVVLDGSSNKVKLSHALARSGQNSNLARGVRGDMLRRQSNHHLLEAAEAADVKLQLEALLRKDGARVMNLFKAMDISGDG